MGTEMTTPDPHAEARAYLSRRCRHHSGDPDCKRRRDDCRRCYAEDAAELIALRAENDARQWISVTDRLPESGVPVLAAAESTVVRAIYAAPKAINCDDYSYEGDTDYDEATNTYYWPEGWCEWNEHDDIHWRIDDAVTHWMPLPTLPVAAQEGKS